MAAKDLDAVFYVRNAPEISFENDGMFHVAYDVGKQSRFEFVFSPNTFLKMRRTAGRIVDEFERRGDVVGIKGRG
jgi:hypothetical protein